LKPILLKTLQNIKNNYNIIDFLNINDKFYKDLFILLGVNMFPLIIAIMSIAMVCFLSMTALMYTPTDNQKSQNPYSQKTEKTAEMKTIKEYHVGKINEIPVKNTQTIQENKPIIEKHETINYDFSGIIYFLSIVAIILAIAFILHQVDKRIDFENLRNIRATKKLIKKSDKFIKNGNKKEIFNLSDIVERQINYNNALKSKKGDKHSVLLGVLNNELNDKQKIMIPILQN